MKEKLKNLCLSILFRLLDTGGESIEEDDKQIIDWLARSAGDIGCIRYIQMRERQIVKALLVNGLGRDPRDTFVRQAGQRFEVHAFLRRTAKAKLFLEQKKRQKEKEVQNKN